MKTRVSVVMAVYNGQRFIEQQISSITSQLDQYDELIVSVDPCNDNSKDIILQLALQDKRIKAYERSKVKDNANR